MADPVPRKPKVIIVDDDRDTREMLTLALELEGFDVGQAANGLRLISAMHVDRPDVILLDVMMSWIDGFELCRAIKKNPTFGDIPVIFISARKSLEDERAGLDAGAVDYFPKPLDMDRLVGRIRQILGGRAMQACPAARPAAPDRPASVKGAPGPRARSCGRVRVTRAAPSSC